MPRNLERFYGAHHLHFITCSCYHRQPLLGTPARRNLLLFLEEERQHYRFVVIAYVVMPEHFHLLITEPDSGTPSTVLQVLKQRFAHNVHRANRTRGPVWQERFYDFNIWTRKKEIEKVRYIHRNPVKRGLVEEPDQWPWSSFRSYAYHEPGPVRINTQEWPLEIRRKPAVASSEHAITTP